MVLSKAAATLARHPVAVASTLAALAALWFSARLLLPPAGPSVLGWVPALLASVLAAFVCRGVSRRPGTPREVGRFWTMIAVSVLFVGAATLVRSVHSFDPGADIRRVGAPEMGLYLTAIVVDGWALFRLPLGAGDARRRRQFVLDISTVMVTAALFFWYFTFRPALGQGNDRALITGLAASALTLVLVFAVAKVAMTGSATIDAGALRALGAALVVGSLGTAPEGLLPASGPSTGQLVVPLACLLAVVAAKRQCRGVSVTLTDEVSVKRPFSVLPYSAVAASSGLLLYTAAATASRPSDRLIVAAAVVALVALVISRQILAFADNSRLTLDLATRERRFRSLLLHSSDFITITGPDGRLEYVSPGALRVLGLNPDTWTGREAADLIHPDDLPTVQRQYARIVEVDGAVATYEARLRHADGSWRLTEVSNTNLLHDPAVGGIVGNARDITKERASQQRLHHQANHDSLTGLANRTLFHQRVGAALSEASSGVAVLLVDLNDFKTVNDTLGHPAGDALIAVVAQRLTAGAPSGGTVARLGGDEFAIVVPDVAADDVQSLAHAALAAFAEPVDVAGYRTRITASIGVTLGDTDVTAEELLRRADVAMYAAKADRADADNRWALYAPDLDAPILDRVAFETELRDGIARGELRLLYQPIVTPDARQIAAVEALVRWAHPQRGLLSPAQFVPQAERSDLILAIGRWVLTEACRQATVWRIRHGDAAPTVSVNVSARQLHDPTFATHVRATLAETGLPASHLTVEITETTALHPQSVDVLHGLHDIGVRISLDDFGTGHSPLSLLQLCPADEIKLDRSFTRTAAAAGRRSVAVAVIQLAHALNLSVVAEGVETAEQAAHLSAIGYHHLQGYYFARPGTAEELDERLHPTDPVLAGMSPRSVGG